MLYAYLSGRMGYAVADKEYRSAQVRVGDFCFLAGEPDAAVAAWQPALPQSYTIFIPRTRDWDSLIEQVYPQARRSMRYAFRKDNAFDAAALHGFAALLPEGYRLKRMDNYTAKRSRRDGAATWFRSTQRGRVMLRAVQDTRRCKVTRWFAAHPAMRTGRAEWKSRSTPTRRTAGAALRGHVRQHSCWTACRAACIRRGTRQTRFPPIWRRRWDILPQERILYMNCRYSKKDQEQNS